MKATKLLTLLSLSVLVALILLTFYSPDVKAVADEKEWLDDWERYDDNPVMDIGESGQFDDEHVKDPFVCWAEGKYRVWYSAHKSGESEWTGGYAESTDLINWTDRQLEIDNGGVGTYEETQAGVAPCMIKEGDTYYLFYRTQDNDSPKNVTISVATTSQALDDHNWTKYAGNPLIAEDTNPPKAFDCSLLKQGDTWYMLYTRGPDIDCSIEYATAHEDDMFNWTKQGTLIECWGNPPYDPDDDGDPTALEGCKWLEFGELFYIFSSTGDDCDDDQWIDLWTSSTIDGTYTRDYGYILEKNGTGWESHAVGHLCIVRNATSEANEPLMLNWRYQGLYQAYSGTTYRFGLVRTADTGYGANFYGVYDEDTGLLKDPSERAVTVTAHWDQGWSSETFVVNGSYTRVWGARPLYYSFDLSETRQYWLSEEEHQIEVYIFDTNTTVYYVQFIDLTSVLDDYPFVTAQRYVNGSLMRVEKRKVDARDKLVMALKSDEKYTIIIKDGSTYTYGDIAFTSTPITVTLYLNPVNFPSNIEMSFKYVRMYAYRHNNFSSITMLYQDNKDNTEEVELNIELANGTSVYSSTQYTTSFSVTWASAVYNTTYYVSMTTTHGDYGTLEYRATLYRGGFGQSPWGMDWLGSFSGGMSTASLLPIFLILCCAGIFSKVNAYLGAFLCTILTALFTLWGWIPVAPSLLILAFTLSILMALGYKKKEVKYS